MAHCSCILVIHEWTKTKYWEPRNNLKPFFFMSFILQISGRLHLFMPSQQLVWPTLWPRPAAWETSSSVVVRPPGTEHLHGHLHPPPLGRASSGSGGAAAMMWSLVMKSRNSLWMPRGGGARATSGRSWTCITTRLDDWYVSELPLSFSGCFYFKEDSFKEVRRKRLGCNAPWETNLSAGLY